jgi:hypothetical protein
MNIHDPGVLEGIVGSALGILGATIGIYAGVRRANRPTALEGQRRKALTLAQYWAAIVLLTVSYVVLLLTLKSEWISDFAGFVYLIAVIWLTTALPKKKND